MTTVDTFRLGWRDWVVHSPAALTVGRVVSATAAMSAAVAMAIEVAAFISGRPVAHVHPLLVVDIPVLVAGQVWGVAWTNLRRPRQRGRSARDARRGRPDAMTVMFGTLDRHIAWVTVGLAAGCLALAAVASAGGFRYGGATSPTPGCPYRLLNHGSYSCVSYGRYVQVSAAVQQFAAGIIAIFSLGHLGSALGGLQAQTVRRSTS